jgi:hypothetical protein
MLRRTGQSAAVVGQRSLTPNRGMPVVRVSLAALLVGSAGIHLLLTPEHFAESTLMGIGFVGAGIVQVGLAALLFVRPEERLYLAIGAVTFVLVGLYCYNVAVGLPFAGLHTDQPGVAGEGQHHHGGDATGAAGDPELSMDHASDGLRIGSGEPVDMTGAVNLALELASIVGAGELMRRYRRPVRA